MQREFIATLDWVQTAFMDKDKGKHLQRWQEEITPPSNLLHKLSLLPDLFTISHLPSLSFMLRIPFLLQKPYLSKDERDFHLLDNPLCKEKVFQTPMVAATSWKGVLRAALWQLGYKEDRDVTIRLLGNARESEEGQAGRLYFYPTFFDKVAREVINPHDRETGVGARGPILMECVRQGTTGKLVLLYVPFGPIEETEEQRRAQVAEDLDVLAQGVQAMLTTYGFGAKTSSGFGTAEDQVAREGTLGIRAKLAGETAPTTTPTQPEQPSLPRYLEAPDRLHPDLRRPDGSLKSEEEYQALVEGRRQEYTKKHRQLYDKAKGWWEREGRELAQGTLQEAEAEPEPAPTETLPISEYTFRTLSELCAVAQRVAVQLREGNEG